MQLGIGLDGSDVPGTKYHCILGEIKDIDEVVELADEELLTLFAVPVIITVTFVEA